MSGLQRFEQRLESLISNVFARTFRSAVQPVEITAALQRELDNNAQILGRDRRLVPNAFHVELSETDLARLVPYDTALEADFSTELQKYARDQGYVFPGPIAIDFARSDDLTTGRFRVRSEAKASISHQATATQVKRARAVLDVNGTTQPLQPPGLVVGRGSEADLRVNDPGISRRHAEFRVSPATGGRDDQPPSIEVHDLGSTNGITVDGVKVPRATLRNGSVVTVGHTSMTVRIVETTESADPMYPGSYPDPGAYPGSGGSGRV